MTKFILHGGGTTTNSNTDKFFKEMLHGVEDGGHVLLVYFSRARDDWRGCFEQDVHQMRECTPNALKFKLADPKTFDDQVNQASVIYLRGGHTMPLMEELKKHSRFAELIQGKVLAGSSAGAYAIAEYAYSIESQCIRKGLGLLPVRAAAHYEGDDSFLREFPDESKGLETVLLREGEYQVFEK